MSSTTITAWQARQHAFVARLARHGPDSLDTGTMVVIPSLSFSMAELAKITGVVRYEERLLYMLLQLRRPELRMIYVTSLPIDPAIIDYYLRFVPDPEGARGRLQLLSIHDPEVMPLTQKLLGRPDALARLRLLAGDPDDAYLISFNVTAHEQALAESLGLPLFGPPPALAWLGSKTGSRCSARQAGARVLEGSEDLWSLQEIERGMELIRAHAPHAEAVVVKLNYGFAGQGNAIVELERPVRQLSEARTVFCAPNENWTSFEAKIQADGAIVEELVRREEMVSPSVQVRVIPGAPVEILSTHDQILSGPEGQVYFGCRFPADSSYRLVIQEAAVKVAEVLAGQGVIGIFGIDFLVAPGRRGNAVYVSEINLRMGGTTHPFWMARLATDGAYDRATGELVSATGPRRYIATDNLHEPGLVGASPQAVIDAIDRAGLGFDPVTGTGAVLHMLGALGKYGKMGVTCIAHSLPEAEVLYETVVATCCQFGSHCAPVPRQLEGPVHP
ncbi:MAG: peptide ligase PGM1-related protein [Actinomycetota bacterium]|nr:peptide ligase PGM1-related protein [Actinomycetota bacterium]